MSQLVLDRPRPGTSAPALTDRPAPSGPHGTPDAGTSPGAVAIPAIRTDDRRTDDLGTDDRRTAGRRARAVTVAVAAPGHDDPHPGDPVAFHPTSGVALALAAARADTVHLSFSARVPTVAAMAAVVGQLEDEIAGVGRDRDGVRIVLDLDVLPTTDADVAARKRSYLEHLDALAGLTWVPSATRVVATPEVVVGTAVELAERVGADGVVLVPLADGPGAERLRSLTPLGAGGGL